MKSLLGTYIDRVTGHDYIVIYQSCDEYLTVDASNIKYHSWRDAYQLETHFKKISNSIPKHLKILNYLAQTSLDEGSQAYIYLVSSGNKVLYVSTGINRTSPRNSGSGSIIYVVRSPPTIVMKMNHANLSKLFIDKEFYNDKTNKDIFTFTHKYNDEIKNVKVI